MRRRGATRADTPSRIAALVRTWSEARAARAALEDLCERLGHAGREVIHEGAHSRVPAEVRVRKDPQVIADIGDQLGDPNQTALL
jgi:hypothetical protein